MARRKDKRPEAPEDLRPFAPLHLGTLRTLGPLDPSDPWTLGPFGPLDPWTLRTLAPWDPSDPWTLSALSRDRANRPPGPAAGARAAGRPGRGAKPRPCSRPC